MRIAYACYTDAFVRDGVVRKLATQAGHWRDGGHAAQTFCLTAPAAGRSQALEAELFPFTGVRARVRATRALSRAAARFGPDVVYLRYDLFLPPPLDLLRRVPAVVEVNTDDEAELATRS